MKSCTSFVREKQQHILLVKISDLTKYPGFSWDGVNFALSSWSSAVVWMWCESNADSTRWVWLLLGMSVLSQGGLVSQALMVRGLGGHGVLGWGTAGTGDLN